MNGLLTRRLMGPFCRKCFFLWSMYLLPHTTAPPLPSQSAHPPKTFRRRKSTIFLHPLTTLPDMPEPAISRGWLAIKAESRLDGSVRGINKGVINLLHTVATEEEIFEEKQADPRHKRQFQLRVDDITTLSD